MWRVRTVFTGVQGSPWLSTMYFLEAGGSAQQAVTAVGTFWSAVDNRMATNVAWTTEPGVEAIDVTTGHPTSLTNTPPQSGAGSGSATQLPIEAQALIRWSTGVFTNGRQIRGRTFVPGLTENDNDLGAPNATVLGVLDTAAAALIADANSKLCVFSRVNHTSPEITSESSAPYWAVLRSRRD